MDAVTQDQREQAAVEARPGEVRHRRVCFSGGAHRYEWLFGQPVANELDSPEASDPSDIADRWVLLCESRQSGSEDVCAQAGGCDDGALVVHCADGAHCGRASQGVPAVGRPREDRERLWQRWRD